MPPLTQTLRDPWCARLLVLLLVGALGAHVFPVEAVADHLGSAGDAHHECPHHDGEAADGEHGAMCLMTCPANPGEPCTCNERSAPDARTSDGLLLRTCDSGDPGLQATPFSSKWLVEGAVDSITSPAPRAAAFGALFTDIAPQRMGDDIFRPPRDLRASQ